MAGIWPGWSAARPGSGLANAQAPGCCPGLTGLGVYVLATVLVSPQSVRMTNMADIRYLSPLILLCVWATTRSIVDLCRGRIAVAVPLAGLACLTTVLFFPWFHVELAFDVVGVCR